MENSPKRSQAVAFDASPSSMNVENGQSRLLALRENAGRATSADIDDAMLNAVFDRIHRDLSFISHHHPHLSMSGEELSVWAKAIVRQLTTQPLMGSDKKDVMH